VVVAALEARTQFFGLASVLVFHCPSSGARQTGKSTEVTFAISGKLSACVISPAVEDDSDSDYLHIVMPLRT
jgi:hypothetical protein